jgi:LSD1 subclass zinc finger protein
MTCADCGRKLNYPGTGRPKVRCKNCQTKHRRAYLRELAAEVEAEQNEHCPTCGSENRGVKFGECVMRPDIRHNPDAWHSQP